MQSLIHPIWRCFTRAASLFGLIILLAACGQRQDTPTLPIVTTEPTNTAIPIVTTHTPTTTPEPTPAPKDRLMAYFGRQTPSRLAVSQDGSILAITDGNELCVFALPEVKKSYCQLVDRTGFGYIWTMSLNPIDQSIAMGLANGRIVLVEAKTGTTLNTIQAFPDNVRSLAWSPDGTLLAAGSDQPQVKVWDVINDEIIAELKGDRASITTLAWSPDGETIAGGTFIGNIILWSAAGGEHLASWKSPAGFSISSLAWTGDSSLLYAAVSYAPGCGEGCNPVYDGFVTMLAGDSLSPLGEWDAEDPVFSLALSPDEKTIAVGLRKGEVKLLSEDLNPIQTEAANIWGESTLAWVPSGEVLFLRRGGSFEHSLYSPPFPAMIGPEMVIQWDPVTGDQNGIELPGGESVTNPTWSPNGRFLTFGTATGKILSYDAVSGSFKIPLVDEGGYGPVAWSPDSQRFAYLDADGKVIIKSLATGDIEAELVGGSAPPTRLMWSVEGIFLAGANWETVTVWDIKFEKIVFEQDGLSPNTVAWSPNGTWLAVGGGENGSEIYIWDVLCNCLLKEINVDGWVTSLDWAANPAVNRIAVAQGGWGEVWDVETGEMLFRTSSTSHSWGIDHAAISPDGSILATSAAEIILWDINSGEELMRLEGHAETVTDIEFRPGGKSLASGSQSGVVMLWDIEK